VAPRVPPDGLVGLSLLFLQTYLSVHKLPTAPTPLSLAG
jgi:hypothetical protein